MGFEPTIPVFEKAKTVHTLKRAATVIGPCLCLNVRNYTLTHTKRQVNYTSVYFNFYIYTLLSAKTDDSEIRKKKLPIKFDILRQ
jgi:hypothetical protein